MASAYKWRITNTKYAYLATPTSDVPVISGFTADEEVKIAQRVNGYSETTYSTQYNILKGVIAADPDGAKLTMLSYKYYYDIDETSCGFTNESIGPQGIQGLQGIQGIQGLQGNDGIGIDYIYTGTTASVASGFRVYIRLTNGVEYYFDVVNGQDGLPASIDYDRIVSAITALNIGEQISGATAEYLIEQLSRIYGREIVNIREILQAYSGIMSTLSADTGSVQAQVLYESGITRQLWEYYNTQSSSITQIYQEFNAYSGLVGQMVVYVDLVSSAVTDLESGYLAVSGMLYDYITRTDALTGDMSGLTRSYNALSNSFSQTIFNITQGGDSGNPYVELSQIYQSCNTISAVTTNSDGLAAGIILAINNDTSDATIFADHIKLVGYDIELGSEDGTHSSFNANGSGYLANGNIAWNSNGDMTINGSVIANAVSGITMQFGGADGTPSAIFNADGSGYLANGNIAWLSNGNSTFNGKLTATSGTIGGFEIASDHIGVAATPSQEADWANLSMYKDFFKVGGTYGYAMLGDDVIPSSAGGAFTATGRIVNGHPNSGAYWGFDQANYGLFISVSGGTKNYGVSSNAALKAPAFVNTEVELLNFSGSTYRVDFSQHTIYLLYATNAVNVNLPGESSVASSFGVSNLPDNFGALVTFRVRTGSQSITLKGVYNWNEELTDHTMAAGDTCELLITKADGFRYQILGHDN